MDRLVNTSAEMLSWALDHSSRERSTATIKTYAAELRRMDKRGEKMPSAENSRTRTVQRAALRLRLARLTQIAVKNVDPNAIQEYVNQLILIESDAIKNHKARMGGGADNKIKRHSKKRSLVGLPEDWRTQFLDRAENCRGNQPSKYFNAMCVLAACGCRPSELQKGVYVGVDDAKKNLVFEIIGSKVTKENGYKKRVVTISLDGPISERVTLGLAVANAKALNKAVVRIGREVFPGRTEEKQISPYSFRHAVAADFKSGGGRDAEIAQALGHRSTNTKALYSQRRGKGVQKLIRVDVEETVRDHGKSELPQSVKKMGLAKRGRADNRALSYLPSGG